LDIDRKALVAAFDSFALSLNVPSIFLTVSAEVLRRVVEGFPRPKRNEFTFGPITGSGLTREEESLKKATLRLELDIGPDLLMGELFLRP